MTSAPSKLREKTKPARLVSVNFNDGMIVTADDLEAAVRQPVTMLKTVLRSYFGCGVVCGFELGVDPNANCQDTFVLCVGEGVAFDCHGNPLELCGGLKLDLSPEPCSTEEPEDVYIAIRRATSEEARQDACATDLDDPHFQCTRVRDYVVVKAFIWEDRPDGLCVKTEPTPASGEDCLPGTPPSESASETGPITALCECLKACPDCACVDESWVLLGKVDLTKAGIAAVEGVEHPGRKYVKPIECLCSGLPELRRQLELQIEGLRDEIDRLHADEPG